MKYFETMLTVFLLLTPVIIYSQDKSQLNIDNETQLRKEFNGFIRGGIYAGIDQNNNDKPYVSSAYSDFALRIDIDNRLNFKAFADMRFRYGAEFSEPVNSFFAREAYVKVNGKRWDLSAGQKIVKWGRADFTNPTSKLCPQNMISRSPDREDMDMGNLISAFNWYPSDHLNLEAVLIPFYRSSVLIIDPVPLPENVTITQINNIITNSDVFSYGLKADIHLKGIDWSFSLFNGFDPMPGTALSGFNLDLSGPVPVPYTDLIMTPFKTRILGLDFETSLGDFGIRGEAAWSVPYLSYKTKEFVPWPDIRWVTGMDWSSGIWRITGEYSGKYVPDFVPATEDPLIGTEPDYTMLAQLLMIPGFNLKEYVRQQVGVFNRLYNYQLEKHYHAGGIRIESDLIYGKLTPSVFTLYNFTSKDFLIIPEIKYKPSDGLTVVAGGEFFSGRTGSLYDIVDGFMNSIYVALKVDF